VRKPQNKQFVCSNIMQELHECLNDAFQGLLILPAGLATGADDDKV